MGVARCPSARGLIALPCVWQALRGVRPTSGASGSVVLQPRGGRRADSPHQQLRPGERGGGARPGALPVAPPSTARCLAFLIPSSCIPEAPGNHPRGRIPQAGGGGRWMLRIPVQIFPGYRDQPRRQARRKGRAGWVLGVCGRDKRVSRLRCTFIPNVKGLLKMLNTSPFAHRGDTSEDGLSCFKRTKL